MPEFDKGIIPAAGEGKRMWKISGNTPKEMLKLNGKPIIEYTIMDMINCGIKEIAIIIHPEKKIIRDYLSNVFLKNYNKEKDIPVLKFIFQNERKGLSHAIYLAKDFIDNNPFAIFLPDNIVISKCGNKMDYWPLINLFFEKNNTLAMMKIVKEDYANLFYDSGKINCKHINPSVVTINQTLAKRKGRLSLNGRPYIYKIFGRYFLSSEVFIYIKILLETEIIKEYDDVDFMKQLAKQRKLYGFLCDCVVYDVGNPQGYFAAKEFFAQANN